MNTISIGTVDCDLRPGEYYNFFNYSNVFVLCSCLTIRSAVWTENLLMFVLWMLVLIFYWYFWGAGSGIGRAACQVLSREGATVIAADKNYDAAVETIKKFTALASGSNGK